MVIKIFKRTLLGLVAATVIGLGLTAHVDTNQESNYSSEGQKNLALFLFGVTTFIFGLIIGVGVLIGPLVAG